MGRGGGGGGREVRCDGVTLNCDKSERGGEGGFSSLKIIALRLFKAPPMPLLLFLLLLLLPTLAADKEGSLPLNSLHRFDFFGRLYT